jgi:uncharacterized protein with HEPN domain
MPRDPVVAIRHIIDAIDHAEQFCFGKTLAGYKSDPMLQRAVERLIEIISEASRSLPDDLKSERPDLPWTDIARIGNRLRHMYESVDGEIIWNIVVLDLPTLKSAVTELAARRGLQP